LPRLARLEDQILAQIDRQSPDIAILVDYPGFHMRLAEQLRLRGIPVIQYAAPKLWAWGTGRAAALRRDFDLVLGVLPFEEEFFRKHQVNYTYVGSPHLDRIGKVAVTKTSFGILESSRVVAFLPGSRVSELTNLLGVMVAVKRRLEHLIPGIVCVVPVAASLDREIVLSVARACGLAAPDSRSEVSGTFKPGILAQSPGHFEIEGMHFVHGLSLEMMAIADAAMVASGTATLECALLGTPMAVAYIVDEITYAIAQKVVKIPYVSLANLMLGERCVQEFIQDFSAGEVADELYQLMMPGKHRSEMKAKFRNMRDSLRGEAPANAADRISEYWEYTHRY
jgi:lipid-A-disaccharide synthase